MGSYVASDPTCVDSTGNPLVANYNDPNDNVKNPKFTRMEFRGSAQYRDPYSG